MNDLRPRVNALRRKMALHVAVVRLRALVQEFCLQWAVALSEHRPLPDAHSFVSSVVAAGFWLPTFMAVHKYLDRCRSQNTIPDCDDLLRSFVPWAATLALINKPATASPPGETGGAYNTAG